MRRCRQVARWVGSMAAIAVGLFWLELLGAGGLGPPPLSVEGAASWLDHRDTAVVVFALLRLCAVTAGWYLLLITAIGGGASVLELRRLSLLVNRVTLPFARGIVTGVTLLGVMAPPPPNSVGPTDTMLELPPDQTSPAAVSGTDTATLHLLPTASTVAATPTSDPAPMPAVSAPDDEAAATWIVQRGESFWSIATEHLADQFGRPVSEREVVSYWQELVEMNRSRLANPKVADLLFSGQEVVLPAVTSG